MLIGVAGFRIVGIQLGMLREGQISEAFQIQRQRLVFPQVGVEREDGELAGFRIQAEGRRFCIQMPFRVSAKCRLI